MPLLSDPSTIDTLDATAPFGTSALALPLGARIRPIAVACAPASFRLRAGRCLVGAGGSCDLVISEPTVSRTHLELELLPEGVRVSDLGSRNGTFYLGQRIERMVLGLGARIQVGAATVALEADTESLEGALSYDGDEYRGMVGVSRSMRHLFAILERLEGSLVTALIEGESGTGKDLVARALRQGSSVAKGPFVVLNCGAIPRELVASELFGHKRGAFSGAIESRRGAFELANHGTLFLDEIGELPLDVQPMLLRALEEGEVRPVGGDHPEHVKVRVIAATNRDLRREVESGRFREDLFYRLAVVRLPVPPLRERPEDIAPLAMRFAQQAGLNELPDVVLEELKAHPWPGNARELRNAVQAYAALGTLPHVRRSSAATLDFALGELADLKRGYQDQKDALIDRFTRIYLQALLAHTGGNQSAAARVSGLDRTYLRKLLAKYGLSKE
jgi:DNA-binding NtrC family response regulator